MVRSWKLLENVEQMMWQVMMRRKVLRKPEHQRRKPKPKQRPSRARRRKVASLRALQPLQLQWNQPWWRSQRWSLRVSQLPSQLRMRHPQLSQSQSPSQRFNMIWQPCSLRRTILSWTWKDLESLFQNYHQHRLHLCLMLLCSLFKQVGYGSYMITSVYVCVYWCDWYQAHRVIGSNLNYLCSAITDVIIKTSWGMESLNPLVRAEYWVS